MDIMSQEHFKARFDISLKSYLKQKADDPLYQSSASIRKNIKHAARILLSGGKRIRPYTTYLSFRSFGGEKFNEDVIWNALIALELFHTFALIHDDVIDDGKMRHGLVTLHLLGENRKQGEAHAILVGDLFLTWAHEALVKNLPSSMAGEVSSIFSEMASQVIIGQMLDVSLMQAEKATQHAVKRKTLLKTAFYTFVHPMRIGMALAGSLTAERMRFAEKFGVAVGEAFQMQDDLLDIVGNFKKTGKGNFSDVEEGQHTYFTLYIQKHGSKEAKDLLRAYQGSILSVPKKEELRRMFEESGALLSGNRRISILFKKAEALVNKNFINRRNQNLWIEFVERMKDRSL